MKKITLSGLAILICVTMIGACSKNEIAKASCDDLKKDLDPAVRADLEKRCPRAGEDFKPSPKIEY